jgi:hypothetical protein
LITKEFGTVRRLAASVAAMVMLQAFGCGEGTRLAEDALPLDKVPSPAIAAAQKELPGVKFDAAWKESEGGEIAFELRGKNTQGKIRDVKVTAEGRVLEVD